MARSQNLHITQALGEALNLYAYFSPSYFNLTKGHGVERNLTGANTLGLHGKAILSKYPLKNLQAVSLPNAINKLKSKEARIGAKRALIADLDWQGKTLTLGCAHLDAFSYSIARADQIKTMIHPIADRPDLLIAGDWNTNTLNSTSGLTLFSNVLTQFLFTGPRKMITHHYLHPQAHYDKPLFKILETFHLDYESCNAPGSGTFDLVSNDYTLGEMVSDQFPKWVLKGFNRLIEKYGGFIRVKLDWFAGKNLKYFDRRVVVLKANEDYPKEERPSDHHPITLEFSL